MNKRTVVIIFIILVSAVIVLTAIFIFKDPLSLCKTDNDCKNIDCSQFNKPELKEEFRSYCIEEKCECKLHINESFLDLNNVENWEWDSGQNCYGLSKPEQCEKLEWPMGCKKCGCRKAGIYNCYECIAEKNSEPRICENIILDEKESEDFWQDNCYWRLVIKFKNTNKIDKIDFCDKFVEQEHEKACYNIISN